MSPTATLERVHAFARDHEPTLDEMITGAWAELSRARATACPVCGEEMGPQYGAHARPVGGRCRSCATTLR